MASSFVSEDFGQAREEDTNNAQRSEAAIPKKKVKKQPPQADINEFWSRFTTKNPGKAFTVLPENLFAKKTAAQVPKGAVPSQNVVDSFEEAVATCKAKVDKIVAECKRVNQKYRDPHFDIEFDLKWGQRDCLDTLIQEGRNGLEPKSVKRVGDIFDFDVEPPFEFFIDGATPGDVRQGRDGDCWLMAALCTMGNRKGLIEKICVAHDAKVGVYGFVFHRDGDWHSTIIDDKLYLLKPDYDESYEERISWEDRVRMNSEEEYRNAYQKGSGALYFAQCSDQRETWLPLLEKAYAKAHGDYAVIEGGFTGEGIEDLSGGVTSELFATDILDKEKFWKEELLKVNEEFLFGCATGIFRGWGSWGDRKGVIEGHAYSIIKAVEMDGERLVMLKNPWGKVEWTGPWSDGSKEWTAEWMTKLNHKFGNDGAFWISYKDLLRKYQTFDRTRLFGPDWNITQQWTSLNIPWTVDYHGTKFEMCLDKKAQVVIVLSQLDDRYFRGLEGQYSFELSFRLHRDGEKDYIVRSHGNYCMRRSVSTELELEAGKYSVLLKIKAERNKKLLAIQDVVKKTCQAKQDKLLRIGLSYDLAHSKGGFIETPQERAIREAKEKKEKEAKRKEIRENLKSEKAKKKAHDRKMEKKQRIREQKEAERQRRLQEREAARNAGATADSISDASKNGTTPQSDNPTSSSSKRFTNGLKLSVPNQSATSSKHRSAACDSDSESLSPVSSISDSALDDHITQSAFMDEQAMVPTQPPDEEEPDEFEEDPWNAVCVVGLKVYSKGANATVQVARPLDATDGETSLDLDDSAADATRDSLSSPVEKKEGNLPGMRGRLGSLSHSLEIIDEGHHYGGMNS